MTDRVNSFLVVLEDDLREDDAEEIVKTLFMIKGVARVLKNKTDHNYIVAETRAKMTLQKGLLALISFGEKK